MRFAQGPTQMSTKLVDPQRFALLAAAARADVRGDLDVELVQTGRPRRKSLKLDS